MEELISALELAIARVDELLDKEECGFVHNTLIVRILLRSQFRYLCILGRQ